MAYNKALEVNRLIKVYKGGIKAVDGVSFDVDENEIFGILGPNGAGKSTIMKTLVTLIGFTSGKVSIFGFDRPAADSEIRKLIGYVPQDISADGGLTGMENMILSARLHGLHGKEIKQQIDRTLGLVGVLKAKDRLVATYSGGMIRKLEIAQALIHTPRIIFLDEPTVGLDPRARDAILSYVKDLRARFGVTVVITTHYMEEADSICDRIAIMNRGKLVAVGTPKDLKARAGSASMIFEVNRVGSFKAKGMNVDGNIITIPSDNPEAELPMYMQRLSAKGILVRSAKVKETTLDDVFIKFTGSTLHEEEHSWGATRKARRVAKRLG